MDPGYSIDILLLLNDIILINIYSLVMMTIKTIYFELFCIKLKIIETITYSLFYRDKENKYKPDCALCQSSDLMNRLYFV